MSKKLKNGIKILVGQAVLELLNQTNILHVLIYNSRMAWSTENFNEFLRQFTSG